MNVPKQVKKNELKTVGMVGPIADGETPLDAIRRMEQTFGKICRCFACMLYENPRRGKNQQFPSIVGTVWSEQ